MHIKQRPADELLAKSFQVLLTHDAPLDAKRHGCGSEIIAGLIHLAQPSFAFFGHYKGEGERIEHDFGATEVYHLAGMELRGEGGSAEPGSVGVLTWDGNGNSGRFEYIDTKWLIGFTRHNWKWR